MKRSASITQSLSDSSPPTVVDTNFPDGSESISLDSEIEISLSEPLYNVETNELLSNIDLEEFFTLKYGDSLGIDIPFDIELEDDNTTIKIVPNIALLSDQTVYFNFSGLFGDGKGNESLLNLDLYFETTKLSHALISNLGFAFLIRINEFFALAMSTSSGNDLEMSSTSSMKC